MDQVSESQESTYERRHNVIIIETDSNSEEDGGVEEPGQVRRLAGKLPLILALNINIHILFNTCCTRIEFTAVYILNAFDLFFFLSLLQQYGEDEDEDEDEEGTMVEGEESNEGSGDVNEPFEGEDTEVHHHVLLF